LVVNNTINHLKAQQYLKSELSFAKLAEPLNQINQSTSKRLFTAARNSLDVDRSEKNINEHSTPKYKPSNHIYKNIQSSKLKGERKPVLLNTFIQKSGQRISTTREHSAQPKMNINKRESTPTVKEFTNLIQVKNETRKEKVHNIDSKRWLEYYESIRIELDQCVKNVGRISKQHANNVLPNNNEKKMTINRNIIKPMFARTHVSNKSKNPFHL